MIAGHRNAMPYRCDGKQSSACAWYATEREETRQDAVM